MICMRSILCFCLSLFLLTGGAGIASGQELLTSHTDILFSYDEVSGQWSGAYNHGGTSDNPDQTTVFDEASLPARDQEYDFFNDVGDRVEALAGEEFTGVEVGEWFWLLPQSNQNRNYTWPGFRTEVTPGVFRSYLLSDPRQSSSQPWVTYHLEEVIYSGQSTGTPEFSVFQYGSFGDLTIWIATSDGIDSTDVFYLDANGHAHANFGFSQLGIYRVGLRASAILDSTGETVTSDTEYVTFAIGTLATWLSDHYSGPDLVDSNVSGMESDSDGDRVRLLQEYAFNLVPTLKDKHYLERDTGVSGLPIGWIGESGGQDRLHLQMVCRKADTNPQIQYLVEFNDDISDDEGWEVVTPSALESIDGTWERVTVVDTESVSTRAQRFARVRIVVQESIDY